MRVSAAPTMMRRFAGVTPRGRGVVLSALHPAHRAGRTNFPSRVFAAGEVRRVLKDGHHSRKIGRVVAKGARRGWPIVTLTLEERATCPRSCAAWACCYGNNMQAAERIVADDALTDHLAAELAMLAAAHPRGFMVRLHVLGDFHSVDYVDFWRAMLARFPMLAIFGFTAWPRDSAIGAAVDALARQQWARFAVRFSGAAGRDGAARMIDPGRADRDAITCPAQTGGTDCCATCALCWNSQRSIAFMKH